MSITIETTRDYSLFQQIVGNRKLYGAHIRKLQESLTKNPELSEYNPILVNDRNEVIDGQHRLEALKRLNKPVHYIKARGLGLSAVQKLNAIQKAWSPMDYARSYSEKGLVDYDVYIALKERYGLNHDTLLSYMSVGGRMVSDDEFKSGKMKISGIKAIESICDDLTEVGIYYPKKYKKRAFTTAFKIMWENKEYNQERMVASMERDGSKLPDRNYPNDVLRDLEASYNKYQRTTVRFF